MAEQKTYQPLMKITQPDGTIAYAARYDREDADLLISTGHVPVPMSQDEMDCRNDENILKTC